MAKKTPKAPYLSAPPSANLDALDEFITGVKAEQEPEQPEPSGPMRRYVGDTAASVAKGAVQGVRMLTDVAGADNAVSGGLRTVEDFIGSLQSAEAKQDQKEIARILKEAEGKGVLDQVVAGVRAFSVAPMQTMAQAAGTAVPTIGAALIPGVGPAAVAARFAAPLVVGAAQGAGTVKAGIYDAVKQRAIDEGRTTAEAEQPAVQAQEYGGENGGQIALGAWLGALAGKPGLESAAARLVHGTGGKAVPSMVARVATGAAAEAIPEAAQGGQEKYAGNVAQDRAGFQTDPWSGVAAGATMEALAGAAMGGALGVPAPSDAPTTEPMPPLLPETGPMSRAANAATIAARGQPLDFTPTAIPGKGDGLAVKDEPDTTALDFEADPRFAGAIAFPNGKAPEQPLFASKQLADVHIGEQGAFGELMPVEAGGGQWTVQQTPEAANRTSRANIERWMEQAQPMEEEQAKDVAKRAESELNKPMTALPMPDGTGWTVVPRQWVSAPVLLDYTERAAAAAQAKGEMEAEAQAARESQSARVQEVANAPVGRAPRTPRSEAVEIDPAAPNAVAQFIAQQATVNTPAARAFVQDYRAGRVTDADVLARITPKASTEPTADERLAAAAKAGQVESDSTPAGLILNREGKPFKTEMAAAREQKKHAGSQVVAVEGGHAVQPAPVETPDAQAPAAPEAVAPTAAQEAADSGGAGATAAGAAGVEAGAGGAVEADGLKESAIQRRNRLKAERTVAAGQADQPAQAAPPAPAQAAKVTKRKGRIKLDPESDTLLQAVAKLGGVDREEIAREFGLKQEELKSTTKVGNLKGYPFRKAGGLSIDGAIEQLREAGYFDGVADGDLRRELEQAIFDELGGRPRLTAAGQTRSAEQRATAEADEAPDWTDAEQAEWEALTAKASVDPAGMDSLEDDDIPGFDDNFSTDPRALAAFLGETYDEAIHDQQAQTDARGRPAQADAKEDRRDAPRGSDAPAAIGSEAARDLPATEGLTLTAPTVDELRARDDQAARANADDAAEQKRLKAKADAERDEFTLTGSDSAADVAAAAGQGGLFDAAAQADDVSPSTAAGQEEAELDAIDVRISDAEAAGVKLDAADRDAIRGALTRADDLRRKAGGVSARGADPMRKGNAFPMGVGFTKMSKRAEQRIDASVRRAGEAVAIWNKADQAEKFAEALLAGKGTVADRLRKAARHEETQRLLISKLLDWKKGDKIGPVTVERVNKDRDGYPATYTISGDGIITGVMDKVDVVREMFGGDKAKFRAMVDEARAQSAKPEAKAEPAPDEKPASKTPAVDAHFDLIRAMNEGAASVEEYRAGFKAVTEGEQEIKGQLSKLTKDQLTDTLGPMFMRRPGETKADIVNAVYGAIVRQYAMGKEYGPTGYMMGELGKYESQKAAALAELVQNQTADDLAAYAAERKQASEERVAARASAAEAVKNPQSLDDYRRLFQHHQQEGKTFQQIRMSLTPEQRAAYDELAADFSRSKRRATTDEQRTQVRVAGQTVDGDIIATKHTKKGTDLFVVRLAERVSREDYDTLNAGAKRIGGYYSSFRGAGAVPGFQFTTREQAEAFVTLAGGDNTAAVEAAKERRDAFADDRSQTAAERLTEMADRLEERADESLGRDRKANTERRARFAASAEASANADKAMAKTMRNLAGAITAGKAKFLDRVRQKTQVEMLQSYVGAAKGDELRARYPTYSEMERHQGEAPTGETADYAEFPTFTAYRSDLASLGRQLIEVDGTKKLGQQIMRVADDMSDAFTAFAKEPGNLFKLSAFSVRAGDAVRTAIFATRDAAEAAIKRSGLSAKAIVFPEKRGVNRIIMSPSEAIARDIWKGDGDKRISLAPEFGAELVEKIGKANRRGSKVSVPWQFERAHDRRKALARMGIETPAEFRAALREFIGLREQPAALDKVKQLERALVGRRNDGMDFFPTPESVADEMVAAADIQPGMRVLEPSAGMGHIADRLRAAGAEPDVVEMESDKRELLEAKGYAIVGRDFLDLRVSDAAAVPRVDMEKAEATARGEALSMVRDALTFYDRGDMRGAADLIDRALRVTDFADFKNAAEGLGDRLRAAADGGYDRIVMNPPFSDGRDIKHVQHAFSLLKPGGRLVAIMGESAFTNQNKRATDFREWLESVGGTDEKLAEGTFNDPSLPVNTGANARMVVVEKPAAEEAAPDAGADRPAFSRGDAPGQGQRAKAVEALVALVTARWKNAPDVVVVESLDDPRVPQAVRDEGKTQQSQGAQGDPEGFFHGGKVYLVAPQLGGDADVVRVLFHESLGHFGLRGNFGTELGTILDRLAVLNAGKVRAKAKQYGLDYDKASDRRLAAEEVLAEMAQRAPDVGWARKAVAAIRTWLREHVPGFSKMAMSDAEIVRNFILPARAFVQRGGSGAGSGSTAFSRGVATGSEAFKKWFGASKVVNADGSPKVMYHGTAQDISTFKAKQAGAIFVTDDPDFAEQFAVNSEFWMRSRGMDNAAQNILPVYVKAENPFDYENAEHRKRVAELVKAGHPGTLIAHAGEKGLARGEWTDIEKDYVQAAIKKAGHDGFYAAEDGRKNLAVYNSTQIKSATGNSGSFNPADGRIGFSRSTLASAVDNFNQAAVRNAFLDAVTTHGSTNLWGRTVGTQYHKAQSNPQTFGRVFDAVQDYIKDTSVFANRAADLAPSLLPKLDKLADLVKDGPLRHGADPKDKAKAGEAIFQGTLNKELYDAAALRSKFGLNDKQIGLYREFRAAVDQSLDGLAKTEILRIAGEAGRAVRAAVIAAPSARDAGEIMAEHLAGDDALAAEIEQKVSRIEQLQGEGYAPLTRFGKHTLHVTGPGGGTEFFGMYETVRDANRAARQLRGDSRMANMTFTQGVMSQEGHKLFNGLSMDSLELFADATGNGDNPVYQAYLKLAVANRSALKRMIERKGIQGYSDDVARVLASFVTSNARMSAGHLHLTEAKKTAEAIPKEQGDLRDDAIKLVEYVTNPAEEAAAVRGLLFTSFIGGSVASALVNMTQPITMTLPYLTQHGGAAKAGKRLAAAMAMVASGKGMDAGLAEALKRAESDGIVSPQEIHHLQAEAMNALGKHPLLKKAAFVWGSMFSLAEQFNRRVSFVAAYHTAQQEGIANPFAFAEKAVIETQGLYNKGNKANWARGAFGATVMTFKQFSTHYLEFLVRMWKSGPEGKKAVAVALALLILMGGAGGLPFADDLDDLIDTLGQAMGHDTNSKRWKRQFVAKTLGLGDAAADVATRGVTALPGFPLDLSLRMGMGNLLPATGLFLRSNTDTSRQWLEVAGAAGGLASNVFDGGKKVLAGDMGDGIKKALPVAVQNMFKAYEMAQTGEYRSTKGAKVMDVDLADAALKLISFQPAEIARESGRINEIMRSVQLTKNVEGEIAGQWAQAVVDGDTAGVAKARASLAEWNANNPTAPIRITPQQVRARVKALKSSRADRTMKMAPKEMRGSVAEALS